MPTVAYNPAGSSSINVVATGDPDRMLFFGNFGTDVGVIDHVISTAVSNDITMTTIGADLIQPALVDPSDVDHIIAVNRTDQDVFETLDGGTTWTALNSALAITVDVMDLIFQGAYWPSAGFIGGNDGVDENLSYTPNEFGALREDTSAGLKATAGLTSLDIAPPAAT